MLLCMSCQVPRKFTSKVEGKMGYEDFVYFILSEEDKSSEPSLEYWYVSLIDGFKDVMINYWLILPYEVTAW